MVYPLLTTPEGKYGAVLRFVNTRARFLGIPHTQSVRILRKIGWTSADIMAAYLWNRFRCDELTLSPDAGSGGCAGGYGYGIAFDGKERLRSIF